MTEKQFRLKLSDIISDNFELGKHGGGINHCADMCRVRVSTIRYMLEGRYNSFKVICQVLEALGYEIEIRKKGESSAMGFNGGSAGRGTRIECGRCCFIERHQTADTFVAHGWTMQENGEPLCPTCSGHEEKLSAFAKYFYKKQKEGSGKYVREEKRKV